MSSLLDHATAAADKALSATSELTKARDFYPGYDIGYWVSVVLFIGVLIFILSLLFSPGMFGDPYYGYGGYGGGFGGPHYGYSPYWKRTVPMQKIQHLHPHMRMGQGGIVGMDEQAATQLTSSITEAASGLNTPDPHNDGRLTSFI